MKRLRMFVAAASLASAFVVVSAPPASASCIGDPVNPCAIACSVGYGNKYTRPFFHWCTIV